jgi:hypothetical protein
MAERTINDFENAFPTFTPVPTTHPKQNIFGIEPIPFLANFNFGASFNFEPISIVRFWDKLGPISISDQFYFQANFNFRANFTFEPISVFRFCTQLEPISISNHFQFFDFGTNSAQFQFRTNFNFATRFKFEPISVFRTNFRFSQYLKNAFRTFAPAHQKQKSNIYFWFAIYITLTLRVDYFIYFTGQIYKIRCIKIYQNYVCNFLDAPKIYAEPKKFENI